MQRARRLDAQGRTAGIVLAHASFSFADGNQLALWYAFKALFWPTPGALHVVGLPRSPQQELDASRVVELSVTQAGLDGVSAFYPSRETFHLFKTCNVWIARALRAAGLPVDSALSAGDMMDQARRLSAAARPKEAQFLHVASE